MQLNVPAKIFVPTISSPAKIERIRSYGADLVVGGERYAEALAASEAWAAKPARCRCTRSISAKRCSARAPSARARPRRRPTRYLLVAVGGGGLIGGIAAWYRGARARRRRRAGAGADAERGAQGRTSGRRAGRRHRRRFAGAAARRGADVSDRPRLRRSRRPGRRRGDSPARSASSGTALRIVAEPGGAAAFSALLSGAYKPARDERVGVRRQRREFDRGAVRMNASSRAKARLRACATHTRTRLRRPALRQPRYALSAAPSAV